MLSLRYILALVLASSAWAQQVAPATAPVTITAVAGNPYLRDYDSPEARFRAGFAPVKPTLVWGEPLHITFSIENLGTDELEFQFGGDYRGTGRHNRYKIDVVDEAGKQCPDPRANAPEFGGIMSHSRLKRGESFTNPIDLALFRTIDKPDVYTVTCAFRVDPPFRGGVERRGPTVSSTFQLVILQRTAERVAQVLDEMIARAKIAKSEELPGLLEVLVRFGGEESVPRLVALAEGGRIDLRLAALHALAAAPGEPSLKTVLTALRDADPAIRADAARALGSSQHPDAAAVLLGAFVNEKPPVAAAILVALGQSKSASALPLLGQCLNDPNRELRYAAVDGLATNASPAAIESLTQCATAADLAFRHRVISALAERLRQPLSPDWLIPILLSRTRGPEWYDSLRLMRMHTGERAIPSLLGCLDFSVPWSTRNWWLLETVKACPKAPEFEYVYDPNREPTAEEIERNRAALAKLKPLAAPLPAAFAADANRRAISPVVLLKTDPQIDFVTKMTPLGNGGFHITSGFLSMRTQRNGASIQYSVSDAYRPLYQLHDDLAYLQAHPERDAALQISAEQRQKLGALSAPPTAFSITNDWHGLEWAYREAPEGPLKETAKADLRDAIQACVQDYHASVEKFVADARAILTPQQLEQLPDSRHERQVEARKRAAGQ